MATGNGHDPNTTRMVELLEQIVSEARTTNERLGRVEVGLSEVRGELITFKKDVDRALTEIHHEIADTNEELAALRGDVREVKVGLREVKDEVHELQVGLREVKDEVHELQVGLREVKDEVHELRAD